MHAVKLCHALAAMRICLRYCLPWYSSSCLNDCVMIVCIFYIFSRHFHKQIDFLD